MLLLPRPATVQMAELTTALKAAVPALEGLSDRGTAIEARRLANTDFSPAEQTALSGGIAAHDGAAIVMAKAARRALKASERAKVPAGLTLPERITRLEILFDAD